MELNQLAKECYDYAKRQGFWDNPNRPLAEQLVNFHSEVSEIWEDYVNHHAMNEIYFEDKLDKDGLVIGRKPCGIPIELADLIIRVLDTCGAYNIDIEQAIKMKMKYNETREYKHGKLA